MKIYNITKWQLIILWLTVFIINLFLDELYGPAIFSTSTHPGYAILGVVLIGLMAFYTVGWRNFNKKQRTK